MAIGRPKKSSDEEIFAGALRVMARLRPEETTLADIAAEAGLTASALVQRFGSKRALLLAIMRGFAGSATQMFCALRAEAGSPLKAIYAYGRGMAGMGANSGALINSLAWLHHDLADPEFRVLMRTQARASRREITSLLEEAVAIGEIQTSADPSALTRSIEIAVTGALFTWAIHQEGSAAAFMRRALADVIDPWRAGQARS